MTKKKQKVDSKNKKDFPVTKNEFVETLKKVSRKLTPSELSPSKPRT